MKPWKRLANRIGSLPARRVTWALVLLFSAWVVVDVFVLKLSTGLSQSSFDAMLRQRIFVAEADPRIVIIDIDEASLARMSAEFGRWPWPRDTLATVLTHVERQQPAAVVWDVLFSDPDRLSPGGDAAFNEAARRSTHSHFSVVRLPPINDSASQISQSALPGLWVTGLQPRGEASTVALIPPVLPALVTGRLGYNNGYVDRDGVLRRYRFLEQLGDGSAIQSLPLSVLSAINAGAYSAYSAGPGARIDAKDELISWRRSPNAYPRVAFADVFSQAEGSAPRAAVPSFANKVVIIGSSAPSLYDMHPTPLSSMQAGVDSLATVIDNALNQRHVRELPRWAQAALAIALCVGMGLWVQFKSLASLAPAVLGLPAALLAVSYLSLNGSPLFVDLYLAAGLALAFLALLRFWNTLRRAYWCSPPPHTSQPLSIWAWRRSDAWLEGPLDRLIDAVERHAPACRVVVIDASTSWPLPLRWPELARFAAVVGPQTALLAARDRLEPALKRLARRSGEPVLLESHTGRDKLARAAFKEWVRLQSIDNE
jgi:CHASE2 domain-containing sensor protein